MYSEPDTEALMRLQGTLSSRPTFGEIEEHKRRTEDRRNNLEPVWQAITYDEGSGVWGYFHPRAADLDPRVVYTEDFQDFFAEHHVNDGLVEKLGPVTVAEAVVFIEATVDN